MKRLSSTNQNNQTLINLPTPINLGDAVNKSYVDTLVGNYVSKSGSTMTGNLIIDTDGTGPMLTLGDGAGADNDVLLKFNHDRAWQFEQDGVGATSNLVLRSLNGEKQFKIQNLADETMFSIISPSTTASTIMTVNNAGTGKTPLAWFNQKTDTTGILIDHNYKNVSSSAARSLRINHSLTVDDGLSYNKYSPVIEVIDDAIATTGTIVDSHHIMHLTQNSTINSAVGAALKTTTNSGIGVYIENKAGFGSTGGADGLRIFNNSGTGNANQNYIRFIAAKAEQYPSLKWDLIGGSAQVVLTAHKAHPDVTRQDHRHFTIYTADSTGTNQGRFYVQYGSTDDEVNFPARKDVDIYAIKIGTFAIKNGHDADTNAERANRNYTDNALEVELNNLVDDGNTYTLGGAVARFRTTQLETLGTLNNSATGVLVEQWGKTGAGVVIDHRSSGTALQIKNNATEKFSVSADGVVNMNSNKIINLATPTLSTDAATKGYVDANIGGAGTVSGPASATDNALVRFDGTTGKVLQDSTVTLSDTGSMVLPVNQTLTLSADSAIGAAVRNITLKAVKDIDRPWISWLDHNDRHRATLGYHTMNYADSTNHSRFEIKTSADPTSTDPTYTANYMKTAFSLSTNSQVSDATFGFLSRMYLDKNVSNLSQFGIAFRTPTASTGTVTTGQILNQVDASDNTIFTIDPQTADGTKAVTLRLFRGTNTTGTKRLVIYKGDNSLTETFSVNADTGALSAGATTLAGNLTLAVNQKINLSTDTPTSGISRMIQFTMNNEYDRPWLSWVDEAGRHRASTGYHTRDYASGDYHNAYEIKTSTSTGATNPGDMITRLSVGTNAERVVTGLNGLDYLSLNNGKYGTNSTLGIRFYHHNSAGQSTWLGHVATVNDTSDHTFMYFDPFTMDGTKNATIRMFRSTSTTGTRRLVLHKGDNTTTETFVINAATGAITTVSGITATGYINTTIPIAGNTEGLRVTQNDTTNNPRAVTIVNTSSNYALKIDHNATADGDAVNLSSSVTGSGTAFGVTGVNTALSTVKVTNSAAQATGSVLTLWATNTGKVSDVFSVDNYGTGQGVKIINRGDAMGVDVQSSATTKSAFNADVVNTSGSIFKIKNTAAQTANEMALLWQSNAASTAGGLSVVNEGTGLSIRVNKGGSNKFTVSADGDAVTAGITALGNVTIRESSTTSTALDLRANTLNYGTSIVWWKDPTSTTSTNRLGQITGHGTLTGTLQNEMAWYTTDSTGAMQNRMKFWSLTDDTPLILTGATGIAKTSGALIKLGEDVLGGGTSKVRTENDLGVRISPASRFHVYEDTTSTGSTAGMTLEQDGTGDAVIQFLLTAVQRWMVGIDNSDADKFKISVGSVLGTSDALSIDTTGNSTFSGAVTATSFSGAGSSLTIDGGTP